MTATKVSKNRWIYEAGYAAFLILYNSAYFLFALLYLPHFMNRSRQAAQPALLFKQRLGWGYPPIKPKHGRRIWLHAVSVGEVLAVRNFVLQLAEKNPDAEILLSTVTPTGQKIAKALETEQIRAVYFPFDWSFAVSRFLRHFQPSVLLLAETEIWPNLLVECGRRQLPVIILNARLSPKSFTNYKRFMFLFEPLFKNITSVLAQSDSDAERFCELGVPKDNILVAGNMKFDNKEPSLKAQAAAEGLREKWGLNSRDHLWIGGSTHLGEEEALLSAYHRLKTEFPDLKLLIAPRHIERCGDIAALAKKMGLRVCFCSDQGQPFEVLILDQLGVLSAVYAFGSLVFMGGSLIRHGGQNPIEAAHFQCALLHGPHTFNFESTYAALQAQNASLLVHNAGELEAAVRPLLINAGVCKEMGSRALDVVSRYQGSVQKQLHWVLQFLNSQPCERGYHAEGKELFPSRC